MTKQELSEILEIWINIEWLQQEIIKNNDLYKLLIEFALYNENQRSWRAAYVLDKINDSKPGLLLPYLKLMIDQLKIETNSSKKRHFLKLLSQNIIPEEYTGFVFDYCLNQMTSAKEPIAVRVHAMQNLFNLAQIYPDLRIEVLSVIEHEMEYHATAGILSRGKKLAAKLRKQLD